MMASMRDDLVVQLKRIKSLMPALREHEEAIHFLPEILEQWIKMQEAKLEKTTQSGILDASSISSLKSELAAVKGKATENEKFEELKDDFRAVLLNKDKEIEEMKNSLEEKDVQFKELQKSSAAMKQRDDDLIRDIEAKDKMIEDQAKRLAFLSEKRDKQDQSKVEDTLSMNRQSKLEGDFYNFVDEARMDACERIQLFYRSEEEIDVHIYYPRLACLIFEAAYERMIEAKEASVEFCKEVSRGMIQSAPDMSHQFTLKKKIGHSYFKVAFTVNCVNQGLQYPTDVLDAVMLTLKETAHNCNLDCFAKDVEGIIWEKWQKWYREEKMGRCSPNYALLSDSLMNSYIHQCIRLAWRMVTQVPALTIEYQSLYVQKIHKKIGYHSSPYMRASGKSSTRQNSGEEIACYLWPGLLDGSGRLIRAGQVLCKMKN